MKTKIKILIVSFVMAAAAVTGFNMAQNSNNMDVSLADIAVMAKADMESGGGQFIKITYETDVTTSSYSTSLGCPAGQSKNCITTSGTRVTTCMAGGNQACTLGSQPFTDTICGNCS